MKGRPFTLALARAYTQAHKSQIRRAAIKGLVEVMRGCGIGCDFCEVTLRPLRCYEPEMVAREIQVNGKAGIDNAWFQNDEIFAYEHGRNFEPNEEALTRLFTAIMDTGVAHANPTHDRISIPAAYPELIEKLSRILRGGRITGLEYRLVWRLGAMSWRRGTCQTRLYLYTLALMGPGVKL